MNMRQQSNPVRLTLLGVCQPPSTPNLDHDQQQILSNALNHLNEIELDNPTPIQLPLAPKPVYRSETGEYWMRYTNEDNKSAWQRVEILPAPGLSADTPSTGALFTLAPEHDEHDPSLTEEQNVSKRSEKRKFINTMFSAAPGLANKFFSGKSSFSFSDTLGGLISSQLNGWIKGKVASLVGKLWTVDDNDSMAEQIAHHFAYDLLWQIKDSLLKAVPLETFAGGSPTSMKEWGDWFNKVINGESAGETSEATSALATIGSRLSLGGKIVEGAPTVSINGCPPAFLLCNTETPSKSPGIVDAITFPQITVDAMRLSMPIACVGDTTCGFDGTVEKITTGSPDVFAGPYKPRIPLDKPKGHSPDATAAATVRENSFLIKVLDALEGTGLASKDENGVYSILFGSIVLGSPEHPGAGDLESWMVFDSIFGYDMSAYYTHHDQVFQSMAGWGSVIEEESQAFFSGIMGADSLGQVGLQIIYSSATTAANILGREPNGNVRPKNKPNIT